MSARNYPPGIAERWRKEIAEAEHFLSAHPGEGEAYVVAINANDFLDLCAGRWHGGVALGHRRTAESPR